MKFILCILLILSVSGLEYTFFGINKAVPTILDEFALSATNILSTIGYIQLYDVSDHAKIFFTDPLVTLSSIEILNITATGPITASQLAYVLNGAQGSIQLNKNSPFGLKAKVALKWKYVVAEMMVYQGMYTADLSTQNPSMVFSFVNNSNFFLGNIDFGYTLSNSAVTGFGALTMVKNAVEAIFNKFLVKPLNVEMNRYNDVIMNAIIYNSYYRSILFGYLPKDKEPVYIKNVFNKFYLVSQNYLSFAFNSSIYFALAHLEFPLSSPFQPVDTLDKNISLYFGADGMKQMLYNIGNYVSPNATLTPDMQTAILGFPLTTGILSQYYPKLAEQYPTSEKIVIRTYLKKYKKQGVYEASYWSEMALNSDPKTVLFHVESLKWTSKFEFKTNETNHYILISYLDQFRFTKIDITNPKLPAYISSQLMALLQPIAHYPNYNASIPLYIVDKDTMNWAYVDFATSATGDATIYFNKK
jgi:hypothetical protein